MSGICGKMSVGRSLGKLTAKQLGDEDVIDEDVAKEAQRVASGGAEGDVVMVRVWMCVCVCVFPYFCFVLFLFLFFFLLSLHVISCFYA